MGLEGPFNPSTTSDQGITSLPQNLGVAKSVAKLPAAFQGLDKAAALAFVSRLFDDAAAGAVMWGDALLIERFLAQCSRTGSKETQAGYAREIRHFLAWRDEHHPHLQLRELAPPLEVVRVPSSDEPKSYREDFEISSRSTQHWRLHWKLHSLLLPWKAQ